ncbi:MAG: DMT family transporter [Candidatus Cyclobacteriaceae bacterium M3_2C_046]
MSEQKDFFHLHFLVFLWGFTAILGLLITIPAVEIVFYRTLLAFLGLAILLKFNHLSFRLPFSAILKIFATGLIIAAHWILFFAAARVATASVCLAGLATTSFWTSILEPLMTNRKIKWYELSLGLLVIVGLYIIFRFEFNHALGLVMALGSALLAALFTVINGKFIRRFHHHTITFYEMIGAFTATALFLPVYKRLLTPDGIINLTPTGMDWFYLAILAFVCTVYAYSASVELMQRISAFAINLTVNLEPVYGIILAVIIFGEKEKMDPGFYLGTFIILLAVLSYPVINRINRRRALKVDNLR